MNKKNKLREFKYFYDNPDEYSINIDRNFFQTDLEIKNKRINLYSRGLVISKELFPKIFKIVQLINEKLKITKEEVNYYIVPDSTHNAYCLPITNKESAVIINSGLVELLEDNELSYIIGHEVGHHIFSHLNYPNILGESENNIGLKKLSQAAEISVDRIGLYVNEDIEACINCMMKIASGLKPPHINFDHKVYINEIKKIIDLKGDKNQIYSSHPMMFVRAKALTIFNDSKPFRESLGDFNNYKHTRTEMDNLISSIISQSEGYAYDDKQSVEYNDIKMWAEVKLMISNNNWVENEKQLLKKSIGDVKFIKMNNLILSYNKLGNNPIKEINMKWSEVKKNFLNKSSKNKIIDELEKLCSELIITCNHSKKILTEELSIICNDIELDRLVYIKI